MQRCSRHTDRNDFHLLPARGTIYAAQTEDAGALGMAILPAVMLGKQWKGNVEFVLTIGPDSSGRGVIVGGTGRRWSGS